MKDKVRRSVTDLFIGFLIGAFSCALYCLYAVSSSSRFSSEESIVIRPTCSLSAITETFINRGISDNRFITRLAIRICNLCGYKLKFGEYRLPDSVSLLDAIRIISRSGGVVHKICINEGLSTFRVLEKLESDEFLEGQITEIPKEGSMLADTYCFKYPTARQDIINQAQKALKDFVSKEWPNRSPDCFLKTPEEAIILASILEKESAIQQDVVAGMYLNRIKRNMRLQACPTVIYALTQGRRFPRKLTYKDLKYDSPYNTYLYKGLPPTPISNPGKSAILAVLHPTKSDWLFMYYDGSIVSKPMFSKTYQEHCRRKSEAQNMNKSE